MPENEKDPSLDAALATAAALKAFAQWCESSHHVASAQKPVWSNGAGIVMDDESRARMIENRVDWKLGRSLAQASWPERIGGGRVGREDWRAEQDACDVFAWMQDMPDALWAKHAWMGEWTARWLLASPPRIDSNSSVRGSVMSHLRGPRADRMAFVLERALGRFSYADAMSDDNLCEALKIAGDGVFGAQSQAGEPLQETTPETAPESPRSDVSSPSSSALSEKSFLMGFRKLLGPEGIAAIRRREPELFEGDNLAFFVGREIDEARLAQAQEALAGQPSPKSGVMGPNIIAREAQWALHATRSSQAERLRTVVNGTKKARAAAAAAAWAAANEAAGGDMANVEPPSPSKRDLTPRRVPTGLWSALSAEALCASHRISRLELARMMESRLNEVMEEAARDPEAALRIGDCALLSLFDEAEGPGLAVWRALPDTAKERPAAWLWNLVRSQWTGKGARGHGWDGARAVMREARWKGEPREARAQMLGILHDGGLSPEFLKMFAAVNDRFTVPTDPARVAAVWGALDFRSKPDSRLRQSPEALENACRAAEPLLNRGFELAPHGVEGVMDAPGFLAHATMAYHHLGAKNAEIASLLARLEAREIGRIVQESHVPQAAVATAATAQEGARILEPSKPRLPRRM